MLDRETLVRFWQRSMCSYQFPNLGRRYGAQILRWHPMISGSVTLYKLWVWVEPVNMTTDYSVIMLCFMAWLTIREAWWVWSNHMNALREESFLQLVAERKPEIWRWMCLYGKNPMVLLEAESNPQLTASKKAGTSILQPQELDSASR